MANLFDLEKLEAKLAEGRPIRKLKVDNVKVKLDESRVKSGGTLTIHATYEHTDGVKHTLEATHDWRLHEDQLAIDTLSKTMGLDIALQGTPTVNLGSVDAKITIDWVEGATARRIEIYVQVANTLHEAVQLGILLGLG